MALRKLHVAHPNEDRLDDCDRLKEVGKLYPIGYTISMIELHKTEAYAKRLDRLRDVNARARILVRVERLADGNPGDVSPMGKGVSELRINYGPGYRVYYKSQGSAVIVLLTGGDKQTQKQDIEAAQRLAQNL